MKQNENIRFSLDLIGFRILDIFADVRDVY